MIDAGTNEDENWLFPIWVRAGWGISGLCDRHPSAYRSIGGMDAVLETFGGNFLSPEEEYDTESYQMWRKH